METTKPSGNCKGILGRLFGHNYQPAYSTEFPSHGSFKMRGIIDEDLIESMKTQRYQGHVCKRCGDVKNSQQ